MNCSLCHTAPRLNPRFYGVSCNCFPTVNAFIFRFPFHTYHPSVWSISMALLLLTRKPQAMHTTLFAQCPPSPPVLSGCSPHAPCISIRAIYLYPVSESHFGHLSIFFLFLQRSPGRIPCNPVKSDAAKAVQNPRVKEVGVQDV